MHEKMGDAGIVDKNVFKIMTLLNNLLHICSPYLKTIILCSVHISVSTQIWFVKLLESLIANHESLNLTLEPPSNSIL